MQNRVQIVHAMVMVVPVSPHPKVMPTIIRPPKLAALRNLLRNQRVPMKLLNMYSKEMTMFHTQKMAIGKYHLTKTLTIR
jgi:hypothetical protein